MVNSQHNLIQQFVLRRKQLKISKQELADLLGLPQSTVARIEAETVAPRIDTLKCIANALSVKINIVEV